MAVVATKDVNATNGGGAPSSFSEGLATTNGQRRRAATSCGGGGGNGNRPPHPLVSASPLSRLLFTWPYRLMDSKCRRRHRIENDDNRNDDNYNTRDDAAGGCDYDESILRETDLPDVLRDDESGSNLRSFNDIWEREKDRVRALCRSRRTDDARPPPRPSLHRALIIDFLRSMWFVQPLMLASSTAKLIQALALGYMLQTFDANDVDVGGGGKKNDGYLWAGILVISGLVVLLEHHHVFFWTWRKGMQYRIAFIAAIYDKSLRLKSNAVAEQISYRLDGGDDDDDATRKTSRSSSASTSSSSSSSGKIVNIATNDVERLLMATLFGSYLFWAPLQSIAILGCGWYVIGWSFAAGFGILIFLFVPLQMYLSRRFAYMRSKIAGITDERVTMISQAISGVRVMKMSGWEDNFVKRVMSIRDRECHQIERVNTYRVLNEAIFFVCNVTTSACIFAIHVATGGVLTPRNVFTTMVLMNVAQMEITKHLSLAVMSVSECWVSISRMQKFLEMPELDRGESGVDDREGDDRMPPPAADNCPAIVAHNVTCHWNGNGRIPPSPSTTLTSGAIDGMGSESAKTTTTSTMRGKLIVALEDLSVDFRMGDLTCIIGAVGSGKSALIQMLAGELPPYTGRLRRRQDASIAYAPQDPWIMDGTVRENVLLGLEYDAARYPSVISACGLDVDMTQLRDGDDTIVGDRGVQLSGGQVSIVP
jgi:ATP-binding cassette subfamily C (CFTR/MRP) protein 4